MLKHVTDTDFDQEVLAQTRPVLVDFWANWCGPCKAMSPTLDALAGAYEGVLDIVKVNADENRLLCDRFGISGLPTLALFQNGEEVARLLGLQTRTKLCAFLDGHLEGSPAHTAEVDECPSKTFAADQSVRDACIARMEEHIAHGPSGDEYVLPMGIASGKKTPEACAEVLGLPCALVSAVDILATYYGTAEAGHAFVLSWLKALPVGADFTGMPRDLLLAILNSADMCDVVADDAGLKALYQKVVAGHQEPGFTGWGDVRKELGRYVTGLEGPQRAAGKCLQTACWPYTNPDVLAETIRSAAFIPAACISRDMGWTKEDQKTADSLLKACAEVLIAENGTPEGALDLVARDHPEFAERYSRHSNRYFSAMGLFGQFVGTTLMTLTNAHTHTP